MKQAGGNFSHTELFRLYDKIIDMVENINSSSEWRDAIPGEIQLWIESLRF